MGGDGPAVFFVYIYFRAAGRYHGLYGEYHAGYHEHAGVWLADVGDIGFHVEVFADAVAAEGGDYGVAVFEGVVAAGGVHITEEVPWFGCGNAEIHTFLGDTHELFGFGADITYHKHTGGVSVVAVVDGGDVDVEDVAVLQDGVLGWYAVADYIVQGDTDALGVAFVVQAGRDAAVGHDVFVAGVVEGLGVYAGFHQLAYHVEAAVVDDGAGFYPFYVMFIVDDVARGSGLSQQPAVFYSFDFFVEFQVAAFVFFLTAAPAVVVSIHS